MADLEAITSSEDVQAVASDVVCRTKHNQSSSLLNDLNSKLLSGGLVRKPLKFTSILESLLDSIQEDGTEDADLQVLHTANAVEADTMERRRRRAEKRRLKREKLAIGVEKELEGLLEAVGAILKQRKDDTAQIETLSTAHQVLTYDHQKLQQAYSKVKRKSGDLEREREGMKTQVQTLTQKTKRQDELLRQTREDVTKSRSALASLRTQYSHELRKREVQLEKTMMNWQRIASESARSNSWQGLRGASQGLLLLNPLDPSTDAPRADTFWDPSVADLSHAIENLQEECEAFRHVTLSTANQLKQILAMVNGETDAERFTSSIFFSPPSSPLDSAGSASSTRLIGGSGSSRMSSSISHPKAADMRLRDLLARMRREVETAFEQRREAMMAQLEWRRDLDSLMEGERVLRVREVLEGRIQEMERHIDLLRNSSDGFVPDGKAVRPLNGPTDAELRKQQQEHEKQQSAERDSLNAEREALEQERRQFAAVMIRLENEKALFEAHRATFDESSRARELDLKVQAAEAERLMDEARNAAKNAIVAVESAATEPSPSDGERSIDATRDDKIGIESTSRAQSMANGNTMRPKDRRPAHLATLTSPVRSGKVMVKPMISSPLRSSGPQTTMGRGRVVSGPMSSSSSSSTHIRPSSPGLKHRSRARKGPATPLARFVTHRIIAETLATAKTASKSERDGGMAGSRLGRATATTGKTTSASGSGIASSGHEESQAGRLGSLKGIHGSRAGHSTTTSTSSTGTSTTRASSKDQENRVPASSSALRENRMVANVQAHAHSTAVRPRPTGLKSSGDPVRSSDPSIKTSTQTSLLPRSGLVRGPVVPSSKP